MRFEIDPILISKAQSGDMAALETILKRYKPIAGFIAKKYSIPGADADDIMQEAMIGLFKAVKSFNADKCAEFKSFAILCITRQIKTAVKNSLRKKHMPLNNYIPFDAENKIGYRSIQLDPDEIAIGKETLENLKDFITDNFSNYEKKVLELYMENLNYKEIASRLGTNTKSVDNAVSRIKNKLKKGLKAYNICPDSLT